VTRRPETTPWELAAPSTASPDPPVYALVEPPKATAYSVAAAEAAVAFARSA
jgi:hypothetical protein